MRGLGINYTVSFSFRNYLRIILTISLQKVHNSRNTPTKPMLFLDNTLKLCGLFYASYIPTIPVIHATYAACINTLSQEVDC